MTLNPIPVMIPPISAQVRFVARVSKVRVIYSQQSAATAKVQATFDVLLAQVFAA